jgi:glycosyltransferase involved in cell wall biosynthesis
MGDRRALVISASDYHRDSRALKFAKTLAEAGWSVTCLGLLTSAADATEEDLGYARLIRVATSAVPFQAASAGAHAPGGADGLPKWRRALLFASRIRVVDDLRHYLGRLRENRLLLRATRGTTYHLVIACNPATLPAGVGIRRRDGAKLIYDVREVWTEQTDSVTRLYRFLYRSLERRLLGHANAVTVVNALVGEDFRRRYPSTVPAPILNGASRCLRASDGVGAPLRLLFQGRFAADRCLPELIEAMRSLRGKAVLTLQGFEGIEVDLRRLVGEWDLDDVVKFAEPVPPSETVSSAADHDVGVINYAPATLNLLYSSPIKLFDYLGAGLAVVSSDIPFARQLIAEYHCGEVFDPSTPGALARTIETLADHPEQVAAMKRGAASACAATCWSVQAERLLELVEGL